VLHKRARAHAAERDPYESWSPSMSSPPIPDHAVPTTGTLQIELRGVGEPEGLVPVRRVLPEPGPDEAIVRVEATGVSFAEQQMRLGKYYDQPPFPFVPGYDLVGVVERLGPRIARDGGTRVTVGQRVAALTKTGAWADRVVLDVRDLVPVPDGLDPVAAETVIVNGVTAWRMLHRMARPRTGGTVVVLGAAGGVGTVLVQLARSAGLRVIGIGSAGQQEAIAALGAVPVDYRNDDVPARVAQLAPGGVDAVFDHVGGPGIVASWRMLAPGGMLVSYGTAATKDQPGSSRLPVLKLFARLLVWNALPNRRRAGFFNLWAGRRRAERFRDELRADLGHVLALVRDGSVSPRVAARFPLADAGAALRFAEQRGLTGKVVITPAGE
jgi:NADPH:quinone reductase-like Zn-dependent oxidoreductase